MYILTMYQAITSDSLEGRVQYKFRTQEELNLPA